MRGIEIKKIVGNYYQVDMDVRSRGKNYSLPRWIVMYLCREYTGLSFMQIIKLFPNMTADHSIPIYAINKIKLLIAADPILAQDISWFKTIIENNAK